MVCPITYGDHKERILEETTGKNIMACPIPQSGHKKQDENIMSASATQGGHHKVAYVLFQLRKS